MKLISSIILVSFGIINSIAQNHSSRLRLVAGYPDVNYASIIPGEVNISAILKIEKDSLYEEQILTDSLRRLDFLRCYPELNKIVTFSKVRKFVSESIPTLNYEVKIFDTRSIESNSFIIPDTVFYNGIRFDLYPNELSLICNDNRIILVLKFVNFQISETDSSTGVRYFIYDPMSKKMENCDPDIYKRVIVNSANLVLQNNYEGEILIADTLNRTLRVATTPFYKDKGTYCDYLPTSAKISKESFLYAAAMVLVNTDRILALHLYEQVKNKEVTLSKIRVFDKENQSWHEFELETDWIVMKNYEKLLAGNLKIKLNDPLRNTGANSGKVLIKGKTKYGPSYIDHFINYDDWNYSASGDLFIYSIESNKMLTWNAGHIDSEVLLIQDETVFFRADDTVYEVEIDFKRNKFNSQPLIVIKDDRIRDVHWAFLR